MKMSKILPGHSVSEAAKGAREARIVAVAIVAITAATVAVYLATMGSWAVQAPFFPLFFLALGTMGCVAFLTTYAQFALAISRGHPELLPHGFRIANPRFVSIHSQLFISWLEVTDLRANLETRGKAQTLRQRFLAGRRIEITRKDGTRVVLHYLLDRSGRNKDIDQLFEELRSAGHAGIANREGTPVPTSRG